MKKWAAVMVGVGVLSLVGCSHHKPTADATVDANNASKTYGLQNQSEYAENQRRDAMGRVVNALHAPAAQTYYFSFDSSLVRPEDMEAIKIQARYLATHPQAEIRLEGNADNRGSREYNVGLGWRRDKTVARIFEQEGVKPKQIHMVSYGKERPVVTGNNERAWRLNRRVHLVYEAY